MYAMTSLDSLVPGYLPALLSSDKNFMCSIISLFSISVEPTSPGPIWRNQKKQRPTIIITKIVDNKLLFSVIIKFSWLNLTLLNLCL